MTDTPAAMHGGGSGDAIVTPEAVRLDFEIANVGSRAVAFAIDWALVLTVLFVLNFAVSLAAAAVGDGVLPDWVAITAFLILNLLLLFGYDIAMETLWRGRTLGKAAMGLRVVTVEGAPVRFRHAAIRSFLGLVDFVGTGGVAGVITVLVSRRHQRLGDMVAGTLVLRERTGAFPASVAQFTVPAGAEGYAATLDPSGLAPGDYDALRSFLLRAGTLREGARADLARRLASGLAARISHHPPDGVAPELFLVCLAARHQQRGAPAARAAVVAPAPGPAPSQPVDGFAPPA